MPLLENDKLIRQYFESVKHQYPGITFERFEDICKTPFKYFAKQMATNHMPLILIKYFGKLRVFSSKIKTLMKDNDTALHFKRISPEVHAHRKTNLNDRLKIVLEDEKKDFEDTDRGETTD